MGIEMCRVPGIKNIETREESRRKAFDSIGSIFIYPQFIVLAPIQDIRAERNHCFCTKLLPIRDRSLSPFCLDICLNLFGITRILRPMVWSNGSVELLKRQLSVMEINVSRFCPRLYWDLEFLLRKVLL